MPRARSDLGEQRRVHVASTQDHSGRIQSFAQRDRQRRSAGRFDDQPQLSQSEGHGIEKVRVVD